MVGVCRDMDEWLMRERGVVGACDGSFGKSGEGLGDNDNIIENVQFGFVAGKGTADAVFIVRRLPERCLAGVESCMDGLWPFVDLEDV